MADPDDANYEQDVHAIIAEHFTPEQRHLPRLTELSVPVYRHPATIEKTVEGFRAYVERFCVTAMPLITEELKCVRLPKNGGGVELIYDYEGAVQLFDYLFEKQNSRLLIGHDDPVTDVAFGRLYSAGYCLGRALLAEEVLRRDDPCYHRVQAKNIANHLLFQYVNIAAQEAIILRRIYSEVADSLRQQAGVCQQLDDELFIHDNNHVALTEAAQAAYENALPKKLEEHVLRQRLTFYDSPEIGVFLPYHSLLTQNLLGEVALLRDELRGVDLLALREEQRAQIFEVVEQIVATEGNILLTKGLYQEEVSEPYLDAAKNAIYLDLITQTGGFSAKLQDRVTHHYLYTSAWQYGKRHPLIERTLDLQSRLCPKIQNHFVKEGASLPEVLAHALWVFGLREDKPLNQKAEFITPIVDLSGPAN